MTKNRGFTLIELMIVMLLGSGVMLAAIQIMLSNYRVSSVTDNSHRVSENGRFATTILTRELRKAGFRNPQNGYISGMFDIANTQDYSAASDVIAVILDPDDDLDCTGADLPMAHANDVISNRFFIDTVDGVNTLMCQTLVADTGVKIIDPIGLVPGIDDMQFLYGVRGNDDQINQYVSATHVGSHLEDWRDVLAIKVGVLSSSGSVAGTGDDLERKYNVLNRPTQTFNDQQARKVFTTTVMLNNALSEDF